MDQRPSDLRLVLSDHGETDGKFDHKLIDFLRRRQRPLQFVIDQFGDVVYSCRPFRNPPEVHQDSPDSMSDITARALQEVQYLIRGDNEQYKNVERHIIVDEPAEKCVITFLDKQPWCLRIFQLYGGVVNSEVRYSALLEPIEELHSAQTELHNMKGLFRLSKREADVVQELVSGSTDKQIANQLGISVETVRAYLKSIRAKLGVSTRTAIVSVIHNLREEGETGAD